jgi:hypothetical protein
VARTLLDGLLEALDGDHQFLVLPIDLIVAGIPSQAFQTQGSDAVEDDNFDVPALFDEQLLGTYIPPMTASTEMDREPSTDLPTRVTPGQDEVPDDEPIFFENSPAGPGETQAIVFPGEVLRTFGIGVG